MHVDSDVVNRTAGGSSRPSSFTCSDPGPWQLSHWTAVRPFVKPRDRKSTRLNSSHANISYAVFCLKKKTQYLLIIQKSYLIYSVQHHFTFLCLLSLSPNGTSQSPLHPFSFRLPFPFPSFLPLAMFA